MPNLEDLIHRAAASGDLNHLTLAVTYKDAPRGCVNWQAGYRDTASNGYRVVIGPDPVEALREVLTAVRPKRKREDDLDFG